MLNKDYILKRMEPYLNAKRELSEFEFSFLFSQLSKQEQYEVINIMIANGIDYVDEKNSGNWPKVQFSRNLTKRPQNL